MSEVLRMQAEQNLQERLRDNPCRGIVLGMGPDGGVRQFCWIMGRSPPSQNRIYITDTNEFEQSLRTAPADPSLIADKSKLHLTIYNAMRAVGNEVEAHIVGNGDQTDTVADHFRRVEALSDCEGKPVVFFGDDFYSALSLRHCEPDPGNFTPRITGVYVDGDSKVNLSLLRPEIPARMAWRTFVDKLASEGVTRANFASDEEFYQAVGKASGLDHNNFPTVQVKAELPLVKGFGHCLTTYHPGSKDLTPFDGDPFLVPVAGTLEESMMHFWESLDPKFRVSVAAKEIKEGEYRVILYNSKEAK